MLSQSSLFAAAGAAVDAAPSPTAKLAVSAVMAVAAGWFTLTLSRILFSPRTAGIGIYERERRQKLREANATYRWFEPIVDELAQRKSVQPRNHPKLAHALRFLPEWPPWTVSDFLATRQVEAALLAAVIALLLWPILGLIPGVVGGIVVGSGYVMFWGVRVPELAQKRRMRFLRRLPGAVDLLALMMEAGASFDEAMATLVDESPSEPVSQEFALLLREIRLGRSRREALEQLRDRLNEENVREFVTAIINGEEFGTPLSQILRSQADQMRQKRSQWAEKAAGEAQVKIVFPGIMIMIACLLIIVTPFIVKFIDIFI